mgnify:FL=1
MSPNIRKLSESVCCSRCVLKLLESDINITRIYYSIEDGIKYRNINNMPIYITARDKDKNNDVHKIIDKIKKQTCKVYDL